MRRTFVFLCALLMAIPVAAANWNYRGSNEPDTEFDTSSWMFEGSDTSPTGNKLYFNGFVRGVRETHYSANVAALGSRMQTPVIGMSAVLGFWKDCNQDGYIGMVEQSFLEYKAELLLDTSICPAQAPLSGVSPINFLYPHNDGTWVRELTWVGPRLGVVGAPGQNPTNFYADDTGVWADWGLPGASPVLVCPGGNAGVRSTGAILDWQDCATYYRGTRALNDAQTATGLPTGGWEEHDVDNSPSPLNVQNPAYPFLYGPAEPDGHPEEGDFRGYNGGVFGRDRDSGDRRERLVTVVDCESDGPDTSPEVATAWTATPTDPASYPSAYESLNDTYEVATQDGDPCAPSSASDQGAPYPHAEGYTEPSSANQGRVEVDFPAEFSTGSRNLVSTAQCAVVRPSPTSPQVTRFVRDPVLGYCPPADAGFVVERDDGAIGPAWRTNAIVNSYATTTREGLRGDTPDLGAFYFTFYAKVGSGALAISQRPSSAVGTYGAEACGSFTSGVRNGWNCDANAWVARCEDPELPALPAQCYRKGFSYHLRDVDCWDGTVVRGAGVRASAADASPSGPCKGHPNNEGVDLPST